MKQISLVKDKLDGKTFAVLLIDKQHVTAFGTPGQGTDWANWVNAKTTTFANIDDLLDVRLSAGQPIDATAVNESDISSSLDQETTDLLMAELNKKVLLSVIETKSEPEPEVNNDDEVDLPDFTSVNEWPISDVFLSAIDVSYKSYLTDYKAKMFHTSRQRRALELEVKWARAIWDNDRQGWRCPPNTVNGGQFTNRMGLGCTAGLIRRLGQTLMNIEDRTKLQMQLPGMEDPRGFLYRAGELIDNRATAQVREFAQRKERRAARRVRKMIADEGKKARAAAEKEERKIRKTNKRFVSRGEKFRDIYSVYTDDASIPARLRAAAAVKMRHMAMGAEQRALQNLNRSERRRYRALTQISEGKLSQRKIKQLRELGGKIPGSKLGGYLIAQPAREDDKGETFDHNGVPHVWRVFSTMDEMHANPWYGKETLTNDAGAEVPNPHRDHKWVTVEEVLNMASMNRATKPAHDWLEMRRGRAFRDMNGLNGNELVRYSRADELRKVGRANGYYGVRQKLKDDGKGPFTGVKPGRTKTKPAQSGPIGDLNWERDELPPTVSKRVGDVWKRSRENLGEWIRGLDPLLEDDKKTRRQRRRAQRSKAKTVSAANSKNILTDMIGEGATPSGLRSFLRKGMGNSDGLNRGFDLTVLHNAFNRDPDTPAELYAWNPVVGTPTPQFETLKRLTDAIIDEHNAHIMTQSTDSNNSLQDLQQFINSVSKNDDDVELLGAMAYHNARVVTLFDGEEESKVIAFDTITIKPWYEKTPDASGGVQSSTGRSGLVSLTSQTVQINAPQDVVERAERGELTMQELVDLAYKAGAPNGRNGGSIAYGQAFGWGIDSGETVPPLTGWATTRHIEFNKNGAPLLVANTSPYGLVSPEGTTGIHASGSRNVTIDTRTGGLISGRMGKETILTPEGEAAWDDPSINPWTGEKLDPNVAPLLAGRRARSGGRRNNRGSAPQEPGIVARFFTGEGRQLGRERREARRILKGKLPRDTRPLRQRIQAAFYERGRRVTGEARPEWLQAPPVDVSVLEREALRTTGELPTPDNMPSMPEIPYIYNFPTPEQFPRNSDWRESGDNKQRLDNLNQSLQALGNSFYPPVTQRDIDRAPELAEIGAEWVADVNDPSQPNFPDEPSNWGHTTWVRDGDVTYVFDKRDETLPPIAIVHNESGTTHLIGKDGKHALSLVSRKAVNGDDVWVPVGSRETHARLDNPEEQKPGFVQTLLGKFRRRNERGANEPKPGVVRRTDNSRKLSLLGQPNGQPWGIEQYKTHAQTISIDNANIVGPYSFPTQQRVGEILDVDDNSIGPVEHYRIIQEARNISARLEQSLKRQLGLNQHDVLNTQDVKDHIEGLKARGKSREAGIMINDLHDLAVLDDLLESEDVYVLNNLKPGRRHALIEAGTGGILTDRQKKQRRPFSADDIYDPMLSRITEGRTPKEPEFRTFPSGQPLLDEVSDEAGAAMPTRQTTGPALIAGVGDVTGTIVFQNGKYFDTTTGRYLEDLSGLDMTSPDVIYTPIPIEDAFGNNGIDDDPVAFPIIRTDAGPGVPSRNLAVIAPGVQNPPTPGLSRRQRAINRIASAPTSFTEAFYLMRNRWRGLSAGDDERARRWGSSVTHVARSLDDDASPLLSMATGLESDLGLSTIFAPSNNPRSRHGLTATGELVQALRTASEKGQQLNPMFAKYLDDAMLTREMRETAENQSPSVRAGFDSGSRSVLQVLDALGVFTDLPFETLYLPSGRNTERRGVLRQTSAGVLPEQWDIFDNNNPGVLAIRHLNAAIQLDYAAQRMETALAQGSGMLWDDMYGTSVGGRWDANQANLRELQSQRDLAWSRAKDSLVAAIHFSQTKRNEELNAFASAAGVNTADSDPDLMYNAQKFVHHGVIAEQLQSLMTKHILTNPRVMDGLTYASARQLEEDSRKANQRMDRLEALRAASAAAGLRNKAQYTPDDIDPITMQPILDPHGDGPTQLAPDRTSQEVLGLIDEHGASGFTEQADIDPATGAITPRPIVDEQIEALALIDYGVNDGNADEYGYDGLPEENTNFGHLDLDSLPPEQLVSWNGAYKPFWSFLEASGFNGHPILISAEEFAALSTIEDANGVRQALPISRGIERGTQQHGLGARMLQRLRRAITGQGMQQHGPGEYWSGRPSEWRQNSRESVVGLLVRGRHRIGAAEILLGRSSSYTGNDDDGLLASHHYEALWAVANALGARGFGQGVNPAHGDQYQADIPINSVRLDPRTGLFDQQDLDNLQSVVDRLMSPGGLMTVESHVERNDFFIDAIIPERNNPGAVRNESAIEERARLNAFLAQNLSWMIQLAQMRRDESDPVNGKANKQWNRRLDAAQHSLVMMDPNARAAMAGYDAIVRNSQQTIYSGTYEPAATRFGEYDIWESPESSISEVPPMIVLLMNRSKMLMLRQSLLGSNLGSGHLPPTSNSLWINQVGLPLDAIVPPLGPHPGATATREEIDRWNRILTRWQAWSIDS